MKSGKRNSSHKHTKRGRNVIPFRSRTENYMGGFIMTRQKIIIVNDVEYTLQSASFSWYTNLTDLYVHPASGRKNTAKYVDALIKGCVIAPTEVAKRGLKFFDEQDDIATPSELAREIENFLSERAEPDGGVEKSEK